MNTIVETKKIDKKTITSNKKLEYVMVGKDIFLNLDTLIRKDKECKETLEQLSNERRCADYYRAEGVIAFLREIFEKGTPIYRRQFIEKLKEVDNR